MNHRTFIFVLMGFLCLSWVAAAGQKCPAGDPGYTSWNRVTIYPWCVGNANDYIHWAVHLYGHVAYENMTLADLKAWAGVIHDCKPHYESTYATTWRSSSLKAEEEFADAYASMWGGGNVTLTCGKKIEFIHHIRGW